MHHRRLAAFLIGCWIAGSLCFAFVVAENHFGVDRALGASSPGSAALIQKIGIDSTRALIRYEAAEQSRFFLDRWELFQFGIGVLLAVVLYLGTHVNRIMLVICGVMLMLVLFMHFVLTPEITWIGRNLDFSPDPGGGGRTRFWVLNALYTGLEILKLMLGGALAIYLFVFKPSHRVRSRREIDPVSAHVDE